MRRGLSPCAGSLACLALFVGCAGPAASPYVAYEREGEGEREAVAPGVFRMAIFVPEGAGEEVEALVRAAVREWHPTAAAGPVGSEEVRVALSEFGQAPGGPFAGSAPIALSRYEAHLRIQVPLATSPVRVAWSEADGERRVFDVGAGEGQARLIELGQGEFRLVLEPDAGGLTLPAGSARAGRITFAGEREPPFALFRLRDRGWVRVPAEVLRDDVQREAPRGLVLLEVSGLDRDPGPLLMDLLTREHPLAGPGERRTALRLVETNVWLAAEVRGPTEVAEAPEE